MEALGINVGYLIMQICIILGIPTLFVVSLAYILFNRSLKDLREDVNQLKQTVQRLEQKHHEQK